MNLKAANKAIVTGRFLLNSSLFFKKPCPEYWVSLSHLAESIVLYENLIYFTTDKAKVMFSSIFEDDFLSKCYDDGIIDLVPIDVTIKEGDWADIYDIFSSSLTAELPEALDDGTYLDLLNCAFQNIQLSGFLYHGLAHVMKTDPNLYYQESSKDPGEDLITIASEVGIEAISDKLGYEVIKDPLTPNRAGKLYEAGIALQNYNFLKKIVNDNLARSLPISATVALPFSPISSILVKRAVKKRTSFYEEMIKLREEFYLYREKMTKFNSLDLSDIDIEEFLTIRYKWAEEIQNELLNLMDSYRGFKKYLESIEANIDENVNLSLSISSLIKIIVKGIRSKLIRVRAKPLFNLSHEIRTLKISSDDLSILFGWHPSMNSLSRVKKLIRKDSISITDNDYLKQARIDFLKIAGKYGKEKNI